LKSTFAFEGFARRRIGLSLLLRPVMIVRGVTTGYAKRTWLGKAGGGELHDAALQER